MIQSGFEIGLHENQMKVYRSKARFKALNCGRRFGKTWYGASIVIEAALKNPGGIYWICSPTFRQVDIMWRMVIKLLPKRYIAQSHLGKLCIELKNGATIWAISTEKYDNLRGEGLDGVVLDEAAMMHPDVWHKIIRPSLMDKLGWALFCTTPRGKNWYYRVYKKGVKGNAAYKNNWESFTFSSYDNPYLDRDELEEIVEDMSELEYEQEILAIFLSGGGTVFKNLDACTRNNILDTVISGRPYVMGVDLGRHQDFTVITVGDTVTKEIVYFERFNKTTWAFIRSRIKATYLNYSKPPMFLDSTGVGDAIMEDLEDDHVTVIPYQFTLESKKKLVNRLAISFANSNIFIPDIPVLRDELESFTYEQTPSGNIKYGAPKGDYDDCVCSLMLCNYGMNGGVALCMGGFEEEITQLDYDKKLETEIASKEARGWRWRGLADNDEPFDWNNPGGSDDDSGYFEDVMSWEVDDGPPTRGGYIEV